MSMNLTVYMVTGYKMNRDDLWKNFREAAEIISDEEPEGIAIVASEGCDDVVIGIVSNKCGVYDEGRPEVFTPPRIRKVWNGLNDLGFSVGLRDIRTYFYGTWG